MESHKKYRCCNICGQELDKLPVQSPMVNDELWNNMLNFYGLSEHRLQPKSPAQTPVFICTDCMNRALGRNISLADLANVPFNLDFKLHHFYKVPLHTVSQIRRYIHKFMTNAPQLSPARLQREMDFINGVLMPFIAPECACAIPLKEHFQTQILSQFSDNNLRTELKRRENERRLRFPDNVRCRDCKHCGTGKTYRHTYMAVTVCLAKPKLKAGPDCYYATSLSCKVCEKFEPK